MIKSGKLLNKDLPPNDVLRDIYRNDFIIAEMTDLDGIVAFNDCGWRSVKKVIKFVLSHRRYCELDVGLRRTYTARNPLFSTIKRLEGRINTDRYFMKTENREPSYSFYRHFGYE